MDNRDNNYFFTLWTGFENNKTRRLAGDEQNIELYGKEGSTYEQHHGDRRILFAPKGNVYDARLVEALYTFARQGATLKRATLFSTTITQFAYTGLNPQDSNFQHLGVTLRFSKPVVFQNASWDFLTLEMMSDGLMWQLTESVPTMGYSYQKKLSMDYDDLSPKVVARFVADYQGEKYKVGLTDCQTLAADLAQRLALHGRSLAADYETADMGSIRPWFLVVLTFAVGVIAVVFTALRALYSRSGLPENALWQRTKVPICTLLYMHIFAIGPVLPCAVAYYSTRKKGHVSSNEETTELTAAHSDEPEE